MYRFNKSVEQIVLGGKKYISNFNNGEMLLLDEVAERILGTNYKERNFSVDDFVNRRDFLKELENAGYFDEVDNPLSSAYLHVTNICNLNCIGCYSFDRTRNCKDRLSLEEMKHILDELYANGVDTITISGGEPMIRKDLVEIVAYAKGLGVETINVITNGTLYDEEKLKTLKPYINTLAISIDGYSYENPRFIRDEGTFPKVISFIQQAKELGMELCILPTLHHFNIEHVEDYLKLSKELKVPISFSLLTCSNDLEEYIPTEENLNYLSNYFLDFMKKGVVPLQDYSNLEAKKHCGAGESIISVTAEGDVYPCHMMHDTDTKMGNILETSLEDIIKSAKKIPAVEQIHKCSNCSVKDVCGGGCKARALLVNGSWDTPDPYCQMNYNYYTRFAEEYLYA